MLIKSKSTDLSDLLELFLEAPCLLAARGSLRTAGGRRAALGRALRAVHGPRDGPRSSGGGGRQEGPGVLEGEAHRKGEGGARGPQQGVAPHLGQAAERRVLGQGSQ